VLTGSCSRLLQGGGRGLLEAGGLDAVTGSGDLRLGVLSHLDDGLEPSTEGSSLSVVRHGDRTRQRTDGGCTVPARMTSSVARVSRSGKKFRL
jgi:hypothetical protein